MNVDLKILSAFDALEQKLKALADRFDSISKEVGPKGDKGDKGEAGKDGKQGAKGLDGQAGKDGANGENGADGKDGQDGVSIVDASVDFDNHLRVTLSDGEVIDAGEINVDTPAESINYISGSTKSPSKHLTTVTSNFEITMDNHTILCDGGLTVTLPDAHAANGYFFNIKNIGTDTVTIATSGTARIDKSATAPIYISNLTITVQSDGTDWWII